MLCDLCFLFCLKMISAKWELLRTATAVCCRSATNTVVLSHSLPSQITVTCISAGQHQPACRAAAVPAAGGYLDKEKAPATRLSSVLPGMLVHMFVLSLSLI
jgi:hypothetical protein